jgi:Fe-S-cluster containining protein
MKSNLAAWRAQTNPLPNCNTCPSTDLCCSQTVPLSRSEWFRLKRLGAHLSPLSGSRSMNPNNELCAFFADGRCSIYEARPEVCRTWR